jgi:hypothetical protein
MYPVTESLQFLHLNCSNLHVSCHNCSYDHPSTSPSQSCPSLPICQSLPAID